MSLETAIEANTAAIHELIAVMGAQKEALAPATPTKDGGGGKPSRAAKPDGSAPTPPTAEVAGAAPGKTGAASLPSAGSVAADAPALTAATEPLTYNDVKPLILKINTAKGREAATAALAKFGVSRGPELKPEQYAEFVAHAQELLA